MKLKRIDEKTIKCFISSEELEKFECNYVDFITRTEKARLLVHEVLEAAGRELGYVAKSPNFDIQIMNVPNNNGLMLTLSEREGSMGLDFLQAAGLLGQNPQKEHKQINPDVVKDLLNGVLENIESFLKSAGNEGEKGSAVTKGAKSFQFPNFGEDGKNTEKGTKAPAAPRPERVQDNFNKAADRMYVFDRIAPIYDLSAALPSRQRTKASLYKYNDKFYLNVSKGAASEGMYLRVCVTAMEFANQVDDEEIKKTVREKAELLIQDEALKRLKI